MGRPTDLVQGTLDLLILRTIQHEPKHGWAIAKRIQHVSNDVLKVQQVSLYPALPPREGRLDQLVQDVRCGTRALTRSRGFAGTSVATLALTIGATTAIISVVWGILFQPLPVAEPERLVRIVNIAFIGELVELRARARTLDVPQC